ncbi:MAG: hypothetical protein JO117_08530 [Verrucomicrobia bacterium]|nr:hypothetical protein [Verrucomicrobiota bacterium]
MLSDFSRRAATAALLAAIALPWISNAAEPSASPAHERPVVPLIFLPPPLENATYALGIFEVKTGRLVRRLHESAPERAFTAGLNGLITKWDRRDDAGKTVPAGHYAARGFAVGPWKVEGVDFLGNEWVDEDEEMRIVRVEAIALVPADGGLAVLAAIAGGGWELLRFNATGELLWRKPTESAPKGTSPALVADENFVVVLFPEGKTPSSAGRAGPCFYQVTDGAEPTGPLNYRVAAPEPLRSRGKGDTIWEINAEGLVQRAAAGGDAAEALRTLPAVSGEPTPRAVSASPQSDRIYLLEETDGWQRVRGLEWTETKQEGAQAVSEWKTFFERSIRRPDPALGLEDPATASAPSPVVELTLVKNPLAGRGKRAAGSNVTKLRASFDEKGSYLETTDGLRLRKISERPHLRAVKLIKAPAAANAAAAGGGALTFYQTDGAAWDEFLITGAQRLMAFDAGEFELTATGEKLPEGESSSAEPQHDL